MPSLKSPAIFSGLYYGLYKGWHNPTQVFKTRANGMWRVECLALEICISSSKCLFCSIYKQPQVSDVCFKVFTDNCICNSQSAYTNVVIVGDNVNRTMVNVPKKFPRTIIYRTKYLNDLQSVPFHLAESFECRREIPVSGDTLNVWLTKMLHNRDE